MWNTQTTINEIFDHPRHPVWCPSKSTTRWVILYEKREAQDSFGSVPDFDGLPVTHKVGAKYGDNIDVGETNDNRGQRPRHQGKVLDSRITELPESVVEVEEVEGISSGGFHLF